MYPLQKSAAIDVLFFVHDTSGVAVTGATFSTKRLSKNGSTFADITNSITQRELGWYHIQLSNTDTNTAGVLTLILGPSSGMQVNLQFRVGSLPLAELAVAAPEATPLMEEAIMLLYMAMRNKLSTTSSLLSIHNNAGTVIAKSNLSDDGSTFIRDEMISG